MTTRSPFGNVDEVYSQVLLDCAMKKSILLSLLPPQPKPTLRQKVVITTREWWHRVKDAYAVLIGTAYAEYF
jgi:hypothetical protein